jgi:hypothetical protein
MNEIEINKTLEFFENYCSRRMRNVNGENFEIFLNGKQNVQTVRLDELNNLVIRANISFIFKN